MKLLDYIIVAFTILCVLYIGRRSSSKDTEDFLTASHSLNKLQAGLSMAATDLGGSAIIATVGYCYTVGLAGMWWDLAAVPAFLLVGLFLAKRFNHLEGDTVPGYLGKRYNKAAGRLAAWMHLCSYMAALSAQFTISCVMLQSIAKIDTRLSLVISMLLVVCLAGGGLKAVVNTDAALFLCILLSLFLCLGFILFDTGGIGAVVAGLPASFLRMDTIGIRTPLSWVFLCFLSYSTSQGYIQRMSAARDESTAQFSVFFTAGFYLIVSILLGLIGITAWKLLPGISDENKIYPQMLIHFLPPGLLGFGVAGVFAATISTATSLLHAMTTIFVKDILPQKQTSLLWTKGSVLVFAACSLGISLFSSNIINILYLSGLFYATSVFLPMALGMKWEWITARAALASMIGSVLLALLWEQFSQMFPAVLAAIPSNAIGVTTSGILLLLISWIDRKKFSAAP